MVMKSILKYSIQEVDLSPELKAMAEANGFETLEDVLEVPFYTIHALPRSGYRIVKELLMFFEKEGLNEVIED